jgi:hypothetical protein
VSSGPVSSLLRPAGAAVRGDAEQTRERESHALGAWTVIRGTKRLKAGQGLRAFTALPPP